MQKTTIYDVIPGTIIANDVYGNDGVMLVSKGVAFREHFVKRFSEKGVKEIFIENNNEVPDNAISNIRRTLVIRDVIDERTRIQAQAQVKKTMVRFNVVGNINISKISKLVDEIIEQLLEKKDIVFALSQIRSVDEYTYRHSVNVGVLSLIIGIDMQLDKNSLRNLGIGAILHDIGKVAVPEEILKKPYQLTNEEFTEIKRHIEYGYEILKQTDIAEEAALIALYHHEKYDGTGYNEGLKSNEIPLFSRIVAIADAYDAMSNDRVYKKRMPHDEIFREITHLGDTHFDSDIMGLFAQHLSIYPNGAGIITNTGHKGVVIKQNKLYPESPVVRIFKNEKKDIKSLYVDVDLSLTKDIYIKSIF